MTSLRLSLLAVVLLATSACAREAAVNNGAPDDEVQADGHLTAADVATSNSVAPAPAPRPPAAAKRPTITGARAT